MDIKIRNIILDFEKRKEVMGSNVSLREAVSEMEQLFKKRVQGLEKQVKEFKDVNGQLTFMMNQKLKQF